ncbi:hypothetical protein [Amaricoccus sp.]|uniref:hypothetical protein n=1 Tax=Amaricoccus sp. TaxID=1872485 RepID=UPI001B3E176E|nr:hypothetical protein [Amaricoccus sp.]MBP7002295.1 hypothetical protein [Amaricoccus sp.]
MTTTEVVFVVTHSKPIVTVPVIENGRETTSCWRPLHQARMAFVAREGRLKIGGVSKLRRARLPDLSDRTAAFLTLARRVVDAPRQRRNSEATRVGTGSRLSRRVRRKRRGGRLRPRATSSWSRRAMR